MTADRPTRRERRAAERAAERVGDGATERATREAAGATTRGRTSPARALAFGAVVVAVLLVGGWLAFGDFVGRPDPSAVTADATPVRMSMAGFTPSVMTVKAGERFSLELWTTDAAPHLQGGVHTFISDQLGIREELPAAGPAGESRRTITFTAPAKPGDYDVYCDSCCGGKQSPTMHGILRVEPA